MGYSLFVTAVTLLFAVNVALDYHRRPRPYKAYWGLALGLSALAPICFQLASAFQWTLAFKLYYIMGALLSAAYMGLGSLYLTFRAGAADAFARVVHVLGLIGLVLLFLTPVDSAALASLADSSGRGVLQTGAWLAFVVALNLFGAVSVVGVALLSSFGSRHKHRRSAMARTGNLLIGAGFLGVSLAGTIARLWPDWDGAFWVAMALGWAVAYVGYLTVSKAAALANSSESASKVAS